MRANTKGVHAERWRHVRGCGRFFNALRDTTTDHFPPPTGSAKRRPRRARHERRHGTPFARPAAGESTARNRCDSPSTAGAIEGLQGDTLASALLANGVHLVGRSFKYHRPRGILTAGAEEPNALVTVRRDAARVTPNLRATQVELYDGLMRREPESLAEPRTSTSAASTMCCRRFFPAGFYYKTFMWPRKAWKALYEPLIRRAAGLGRAPTQPDPDRYAQRYAHCDVLVVGAGPAGIAAALTAADGGARVILCDETGRASAAACWRIPHGTHRRLTRRSAWVQRTHRGARAAIHGVTLLTRTTAFGYFPHNVIGLNERLTRSSRSAVRGQCARAAVAGARARGGARDRRDRAAAGVSGQRPAGHHAGRRRANLSQSLRRARGRRVPSSSRRPTMLIRRRSICRPRASRSPRSRICARRPHGALPEAARAARASKF